MDIALISGLWLPASVWDDVATELETLGHRALPVALPGGDGSLNPDPYDRAGRDLTIRERCVDRQCWANGSR